MAWADTTRRLLVDANGLRFEVFEAGDPSSDRFAICLHGFPESAYSWRFQVPLLAALGYHVWAPNLRGYGESSKPPGVPAYRIDELVNDVVGLIDAHRARADTNEVVLIGHDWGAAVAWSVASRDAASIDRLVIMNVPHPAIFAEVLRTDRAQLKASWYIFFFQIPGLPEALLRANHAARIKRMFLSSTTNPSTFTEADADVYAANFDRPGAATAMINYYRALWRNRRDAVAVAEIAVPTLMIWGEADVALTKATTYGTERYVDDLTLRYLPGVSHWVQQDAPEDVNRMLSAWLTGAEVPEAGDR